MNLDRINFFIQLASGGATIISFYLTINPKNDIDHRYLLIFFGIGTLGFIFKNSLAIQVFRISTFFQKRNASTILINLRRIRLSFLDIKGEKVNFFEETYFEKITKNSLFTSKLWASGSLDLHSLKSLNCTYEFRSKGEIGISYLNGKSIERGFFRSTSYYAYSINILDSYTSIKEDWTVGFQNPTKEFCLELSFPHDRAPTNPKLYKLEGEVKTLLSTVPLIVNKVNSISIQLKLFNLNKKDKFTIEWDWPIPQKTNSLLKWRR